MIIMTMMTMIIIMIMMTLITLGFPSLLFLTFMYALAFFAYFYPDRFSLVKYKLLKRWYNLWLLRVRRNKFVFH